jgi:hypothetical protein
VYLVVMYDGDFAIESVVEHLLDEARVLRAVLDEQQP